MKQRKTHTRTKKNNRRPLRYAKVDGSTQIYGTDGRLNERLTQIYLDIARSSTDSHARGVVFSTSLFMDEAQKQGKDCSASIDEVRGIVKSILETQYGATLTYTVESHANVHCEDGANPFTLSTLIANMSIGFERLKAHKWRKGRNPLTMFRPVMWEKIKYREDVMDASEPKFMRSPVYFFQVKGKKLTPIDLLRKSQAKLSGWSKNA